MQNDYLSVSQVAKLKGISRNAVYKAVQEGRLSSTLLVGVIAIARHDAEAWIPKSRTGRRQGIRASPETKAKMSLAHRLRWQRRKNQN